VSTGKRHSEEFKEAIVSKIVNRGARTIDEICLGEGITKSTAANWLRIRGKASGMVKQLGTKQWSSEEKLNAVADIRGLTEEKFGEYLRREGLHSQQVLAWRDEMMRGLSQARPSAAKKDERDEKIKSLERELLRKDKALAEASALLILQKKIDLIWGNKSGEEK
jgi:transposase